MMDIKNPGGEPLNIDQEWWKPIDDILSNGDNYYPLYGVQCIELGPGDIKALSEGKVLYSNQNEYCVLIKAKG